MYRLAAGTLALTLALVAVSPGAEAAKAAKAKTKAKQVVLVEGDKPAKVSQKDLVRIVGTGIAGSTITAKAEGPGKIVATAYVSTIKNGQPVLGTTVKQYTIKTQAFCFNTWLSRYVR